MTETTTPRKQPRDHKGKQASRQRAEISDEPVSFVFDAEEFTIRPSDSTGLEFLAALDDGEIVKAIRLLLGHEQAARLFSGRNATQLRGFFDAVGEAIGVGNQ